MRRWIGPASIIAAACAVVPLRASLAWGPEAHRTIAMFADRVLQQSDPGVRAKVLAVLATDKGNKLTKNDIAGEATWADALREKSEEARSATTPWHLARLNAASPDVGVACFGRKPLPEGYPASHGPRENCSIDKIMQFAAELSNAETTSFERLAAVQFLLNLVGDLHDPLNAIDHGDQGGNCVALQIGEKPPVRLSSYWQSTLAGEAIGGDPAKGAAQIAASVPPAEAPKLAAGTPETWAQETYEVAKTVTYSFAAEKPAGTYSFPAAKGQVESCASVNLYKVGPEYETKALAAVKAQLAKAGVRLARILRDGFK
jgi:S1/P1 Nuclease